MLSRITSQDGKKFLIATAGVFIVVVTILSRVMFESLEIHHNLPLAQWSTSMLYLHSAWVSICCIMFTILGALPFGFYFLGPKNSVAH